MAPRPGRSRPSPRRSQPAPGRSSTRLVGCASAGIGFRASSLEAERIVGFLRGELPFHGIRVADTVTLHLPPDGGGTRARIVGERLRHRSSWTIEAWPGNVYSLVPPADLTELATAVGRHFACFEYPLESRVPELAGLPHVGTRLAPPEPASCLQSWNLTLVFHPLARSPTLVAAVYDQWEW